MRMESAYIVRNALKTDLHHSGLRIKVRRASSATLASGMGLTPERAGIAAAGMAALGGARAVTWRAVCRRRKTGTPGRAANSNALTKAHTCCVRGRWVDGLDRGEGTNNMAYAIRA